MQEHLTCKIKDLIGAYIYFGYLGITALITTLVALALNKKTMTLIALAVSSCAIVLSNPFLGSNRIYYLCLSSYK